VPLRNYSPESLISQNPPGFSFFQPGLLPPCNSNRGEEKGWRGLPAAREVLAVTSRCGSSTVMVVIGLTACAGGRARRRRVLRHAHGGRAQSNGTGSFTGCQGCYRYKESTNGLPWSSVYVRRRPIEVWRRQSGISGEVLFYPRLGELH
jgi:hypothetical protein